MFTKDEILLEVKKLAKELGRTPSAAQFKERTGIGQYHFPKYSWANYGELVLEAGLRPNVFDKTKFKDEDLIRIIIKIIREKRKWPTRSELEIKHYNDPKFPAYSTFTKSLGLTKIMAEKVLNYVDNKRGYVDIIAICKPIMEEKNDDIGDQKSGQMDYGWVYLIRHGKHNQFRIGKTGNLLKRLGQNRIELPEGATPIWSIETDDKTGVETYWQNRFKPKALNGDWFKLTPADVKAFKRWRKIF